MILPRLILPILKNTFKILFLIHLVITIVLITFLRFLRTILVLICMLLLPVNVQVIRRRTNHKQTKMRMG